MSDKDTKLWESTFGDDSDSDEPEQLSRVRQKKNRHGNKLLVWSLFIILLLTVLIKKRSALNPKRRLQNIKLKVKRSKKPKK